MRQTIEYIHHFTCDSCLGWWSIAAHEKYHPKEYYCPHCGDKQPAKENTEGNM
jgi:predicted RNA-binding Zn-ribbon protein involved in translation (DUF1610 family)